MFVVACCFLTKDCACKECRLKAEPPLIEFLVILHFLQHGIEKEEGHLV